MSQNNVQPQLAPAWKRMIAFLLDAFFMLCLFRFVFFPIFIAKNWDLFLNFQKTILIPIIVMVLLFLFKDLFGGISVGKYFCAIGVRRIDKQTSQASFLALFSRNISLLILPLELFFLLFDNYNRRWGDKLAGVFVLNFQQELQKNPIRWFSKRLVFFILLITFTVSGYFFTAPLQIKKSYAYEITKKKLENNESLLQNFGKIIEYSYWVDFYYDKTKILHIQYRFFGQYFQGRASFSLNSDKKKKYTIKKMEIVKIH